MLCQYRLATHRFHRWFPFGLTPRGDQGLVDNRMRCGQRSRLFVPPARPKPEGARPRMPDRPAMDAMFYVPRTGCQWKALPRSVGAASTVHGRFQEWVQAGVFAQVGGGRPPGATAPRPALPAVRPVYAGAGGLVGPSQAAGTAGGGRGRHGGQPGLPGQAAESSSAPVLGIRVDTAQWQSPGASVEQQRGLRGAAACTAAGMRVTAALGGRPGSPSARDTMPWARLGCHPEGSSRPAHRCGGRAGIRG